MKTDYYKFVVFSLLAVMLVTGCGPVVQVNAASLPEKEVKVVMPAVPTPTMAPQATEEPVVETNHTLIPVTGSGKEQVIHDQVNTSTASQKRAFGGDEYNSGRFERPFDEDMKFLAYLDIVKSTLQRDDPNFIFAKIQVAVPISTAEGNPALYGLELDTNHDGRNEYLILAERPQNSEWSVFGVNVWKSTSAENPIDQSGPSIPVTGSMGFDVSVFAAGKGDDSDLAWVRLSPDKEDTIEIAFKNSLIGGEKGAFVWRPLTDGSPYPTTAYDLHLSHTLEQAGSPLKDSMFYPLKEVFAVDNTCRVASGYEASGKEPGLCPLPPPPSKPEKPQSRPSNPNNQPPQLF